MKKWGSCKSVTAKTGKREQRETEKARLPHLPPAQHCAVGFAANAFLFPGADEKLTKSGGALYTVGIFFAEFSFSILTYGRTW
ncbi:MAG: hypothetical protein LUF91_03520 [Oscillospiraceae bacterium]|nr:hypothetical protein [Oscillospiraceae bacterium]